MADVAKPKFSLKIKVGSVNIKQQQKKEEKLNVQIISNTYQRFDD